MIYNFIIIRLIFPFLRVILHYEQLNISSLGMKLQSVANAHILPACNISKVLFRRTAIIKTFSEGNDV